jgi:hypothetical protein
LHDHARASENTVRRSESAVKIFSWWMRAGRPELAHKTAPTCSGAALHLSIMRSRAWTVDRRSTQISNRSLNAMSEPRGLLQAIGRVQDECQSVTYQWTG